jgi:transmembrane sensor
VIADEAKGRFSTALFEGRVSVRNHRTSEQVVMEPNTVVRLENGYLYVDELENCDEYLWTEGILSFRNDSFDEVVEKLRKYYDVEIEIRCATLPKVAYGRLKIRISEGIEHALRVLQLASDFTYEYDHDRNRIIIQ